MIKIDKRKNNGAKPKYGELKKTRSMRLTDTAYLWLLSNGGADFIEKQSRLKK